MAHNTSAPFVWALGRAARSHFNADRIAATVLPTDWKLAPDILREIYCAIRPSVALHFGVSPRATKLVIETRATNNTNTFPDVCGRVASSACLVEGGIAVRPVTTPVTAILRRLDTVGIPACRSRDCGAYLCNAILYASLAFAAAEQLATRVGFVHLPAVLGPQSVAGAEASPLTWTDAITGCLVILDLCLRDFYSQSPARGSSRRARSSAFDD